VVYDTEAPSHDDTEAAEPGRHRGTEAPKLTRELVNNTEAPRYSGSWYTTPRRRGVRQRGTEDLRHRSTEHACRSVASATAGGWWLFLKKPRSRWRDRTKITKRKISSFCT